MRLTREVRYSPAGDQATPINTWAGPIVDDPFAPLQTLRITVEGAPDKGTGYLCDIKELDAVIRTHVGPCLRHSLRPGPSGLRDGLSALSNSVRIASEYCPGGTRLIELGWSLSPYLQFTALNKETVMVTVTRSFEFAAAHRLYCAALSDEENRRRFGKCSNPHGHGHNYVLEVTVGGSADNAPGITDLDRIVQERVIEPFDHRNLNTECADFAGINPTVENIARVIFARLREAMPPGQLSRVKVWETPKTCAECDGED